MPKTKSVVTPKKKIISSIKEEPLTADELVGQGVSREFDGVVDNRRIPDADMPTHFMEGVLEIAPEGHGYLRPQFIPSDKDVYISASQIRRFNLRPGDMIG